MMFLPHSKATKPFQKGDGLASPGAWRRWRRAFLSLLMSV